MAGYLKGLQDCAQENVRAPDREFDKRDGRILDWNIVELTGGQQKSLTREMAESWIGTLQN